MNKFCRLVIVILLTFFISPLPKQIFAFPNDNSTLPRILQNEEAGTKNQEQVFSQQTTDGEEQASPKIQSLQSILESISTLKEEISEKEYILKGAISKKEQQELENEIGDLKSNLRLLEENFSEIAAGVDLGLFEKEPSMEFDLAQQVKEILMPVFDEIRKVTARPREIDRLRREVSDTKEKSLVIKKATKNINKLVKEATGKDLKTALSKSEKSWLLRELQVETKLTIAREQLRQKLSENGSLSETIQHLLRIFFRSRGRNLLFALIAFLGVYIGLWKTYGTIKNSKLLQINNRRFSIRLFDLIYRVSTIIAGFLIVLLVFYLAGDWLLLTFAVIIIFGIIWAFKQTLPRFMNEAKFVLNLGTVREGERVNYNGLPWYVKSVGLATFLINKELSGGEIRLPLRSIVDLHSRQFKDEEPWFPTRVGDWVILADDVYGRVLVQTPEFVEILALGGSRKMYQTTAFLGQNPLNLSSNFCLFITFGIDYKHQQFVTKDIPQKLETMINERLITEGYTEYVKSIKVEFKEANASSLDLDIIAAFSGKAADRYYALRRLIQRICVDACNYYGWVIPFPQVTLSMASSAQKDDREEVNKKNINNGEMIFG
ncbi:MAG: hypothetical protein V1872_11390 [bacterium]